LPLPGDPCLLWSEPAHAGNPPAYSVPTNPTLAGSLASPQRTPLRDRPERSDPAPGKSRTAPSPFGLSPPGQAPPRQEPSALSTPAPSIFWPSSSSFPPSLAQNVPRPGPQQLAFAGLRSVSTIRGRSTPSSPTPPAISTSSTRKTASASSKPTPPPTSRSRKQSSAPRRRRRRHGLRPLRQSLHHRHLYLRRPRRNRRRLSRPVRHLRQLLYRQVRRELELHLPNLAGAPRTSATGIAATADAVFLTGNIFSIALPVTPDAVLPSLASGSTENGFVEISTSGPSLLYATYLTGADGNTAADTAGNAYIADTPPLPAFPPSLPSSPTSSAPAPASSQTLPRRHHHPGLHLYPGTGITSLALDPATQTLLLTGSISLGQFPVATVATPLVNTPYRTLLRLPLDASSVLSSTILAPGTQTFVTPSPTPPPGSPALSAPPSYPSPLSPPSATASPSTSPPPTSSTRPPASADSPPPTPATPQPLSISPPSQSIAPVSTSSPERSTPPPAPASSPPRPSTSRSATLPPQPSPRQSMTPSSPPAPAPAVSAPAPPPFSPNSTSRPPTAAPRPRPFGRHQPYPHPPQPRLRHRHRPHPLRHTLHHRNHLHLHPRPCRRVQPPALRHRPRQHHRPSRKRPCHNHGPPRHSPAPPLPRSSSPPRARLRRQHLHQPRRHPHQPRPADRHLQLRSRQPNRKRRPNLLHRVRLHLPHRWPRHHQTPHPRRNLPDHPGLNRRQFCHQRWPIHTDRSLGTGSLLLTGFTQAAALSLSTTAIDFGTQYPGSIRLPRFLYISNNPTATIPHTAVTPPPRPSASPTAAPPTSPLTPSASSRSPTTPPRTPPPMPSPSPSIKASPPPYTEKASPLPRLQRPRQPQPHHHPAAINFPDPVAVTAISAAPQVVAIQNAGTEAIPIALTLNGDFTETTTCPANLAPSTSCSVSLNFTPSQPGTAAGLLSITTTPGNSPTYIPLSALALALLDTPATIDLGNQILGQPTVLWTRMAHPLPTLIATVTTASDFSVLLVEDLGYGHGHPPLSAITSPVTSPCTDCWLGVEFRPTATGPRTATIELSSAAAGKPDTLSLFGTGTPLTGLVLTPVNPDFGDIPVSSTSAPKPCQPPQSHPRQPPHYRLRTHPHRRLHPSPPTPPAAPPAPAPSTPPHLLPQRPLQPFGHRPALRHPQHPDHRRQRHRPHLHHRQLLLTFNGATTANAFTQNGQPITYILTATPQNGFTGQVILTCTPVDTVQFASCALLPATSAPQPRPKPPPPPSTPSPRSRRTPFPKPHPPRHPDAPRPPSPAQSPHPRPAHRHPALRRRLQHERRRRPLLPPLHPRRAISISDHRHLHRRHPPNPNRDRHRHSPAAQ